MSFWAVEAARHYDEAQFFGYSFCGFPCFGGYGFGSLTCSRPNSCFFFKWMGWSGYGSLFSWVWRLWVTKPLIPSQIASSQLLIPSRTASSQFSIHSCSKKSYHCYHLSNASIWVEEQFWTYMHGNFGEFFKESIISPKGLLNKMTLASGIRCTVGVASQPSLLTLQLFISPNFSLTATTLESGLESQPASFGFMSHASDYTGAKGVDLFGLPTQQWKY